MPGRDRTGPLGRGAMSGWGYGNCIGSNVREIATPRPWRGLAMNVRSGGGSHGAPGGYGWCNSHGGARRQVRRRATRWSRPVTAPPNDVPGDKEALKQRLQWLQSEMAAINKQLDEWDEAAEEEAAENDPL